MGADFILAIIVATLASSGLWSFVLYLIQRKDKEKDALTKLMLGLAYREIMKLCLEYIERGSITKDEYEDLIKYLYDPYKELGGDGTAERLVNAVKALPIKEEKRAWEK